MEENNHTTKDIQMHNQSSVAFDEQEKLSEEGLGKATLMQQPTGYYDSMVLSNPSGGGVDGAVSQKSTITAEISPPPPVQPVPSSPVNGGNGNALLYGFKFESFEKFYNEEVLQNAHKLQNLSVTDVGAKLKPIEKMDTCVLLTSDNFEQYKSNCRIILHGPSITAYSAYHALKYCTETIKLPREDHLLVWIQLIGGGGGDNDDVLMKLVGEDNV